MKIVVASHGELCTGMLDSLKMIAGENENVFSVQLTDAGIAEFTKNLHSLLDELITNDKVLIMCDLKGGTPYNQSLQYHLEHPDYTRVVSGVNLPMLIETALMIDTADDLDSIADVAVNAAKAGIEVVMPDDTTDEDDLDL